MAKKNVVAMKHRFTPMFSFLWLIGLGWLYLDRFNAPGWAFGVMWTVAALLTIGSLVDFFTQVGRTPVWEPADD